MNLSVFSLLTYRVLWASIQIPGKKTLYIPNCGYICVVCVYACNCMRVYVGVCTHVCIYLGISLNIHLLK